MASIHRAHEHHTVRGDGKWRLTYFNLTARGLAVVIALEQSELDWEADIIPLSEWKARKPGQPAFVKQLPVMDIPGVATTTTTIGQSVAILNCVADSGGLAGDGPDFAVSQMLIGEAEEWYSLVYDHALKPLIGDAWDQARSDALWREGGAWWKLRSRIGMLVPLLAERRKKRSRSANGEEDGVGVDRFTSSGVTIGEVNLFAMLHQAMTGPFPGAADFSPLDIKPDDSGAAAAVPPYCFSSGSGDGAALLRDQVECGAALSLRLFYDRMLALPAVERTLSGNTPAGELLSMFAPDPLKK